MKAGGGVFTRNARDIAQIIYQFSLGAAIKTPKSESRLM